ncbi:MAG: hypothetical protein KZQ89_18345 [Candidatus Thiodiazotropha sp. (ex Lucinoma kastoroae)]|nr:hypothetical protein [Candidatus Thiodiazotropha sp. (ex Lucinoma kastoroae)]
MNFEEEIARLNEHFFFSEFTFSKNTFQPHPSEEVELADSIIWLDDQVVVFQLKERNKESETTEKEEARWFERKVLTRGSKQIRDTLSYLESHKRIDIANNKGHAFHLESGAIAVLHKIICYLPHKQLPIENRLKKYHQSETAGIIHLIQAPDYIGIVQTLLTPPELNEYLSFREELIQKWGGKVNAVNEQALMGQYLHGNSDEEPHDGFIEYLAALTHKAEEWDVSGIIKFFPDRITTENMPTDYYRIISELAKLKRNELREFKMRFQLSMEKCRANKFTKPYRMACPRTQCGFVFIPLESDFIERRAQGLENLTYGCKYDLKLSKCVGISFAPEDQGWYSVHWCYMEFPWEQDSEADAWLKESSPFREVNETELNRYTYQHADD